MQDLMIKLKLLDEMTTPLKNAINSTRQFTGTVGSMTTRVNTAKASLKQLQSFAKLKDGL